MEEGASGYLLKDMPTDAIVQAIMTVQSGGMVLPKELTSDIVKEMRKNQSTEQINTVPEIVKELTERELEVLNKLGLGLNNKEIAEKLYISEGTVKNHVSNLISKLQLRDRTQAAIFAVRYHITHY